MGQRPSMTWRNADRGLEVLLKSVILGFPSLSHQQGPVFPFWSVIFSLPSRAGARSKEKPPSFSALLQQQPAGCSSGGCRIASGPSASCDFKREQPSGMYLLWLISPEDWRGWNHLSCQSALRRKCQGGCITGPSFHPSVVVIQAQLGLQVGGNGTECGFISPDL